MNTFDLVTQLTSGDPWRSDQQRYLFDFASDLGWKPSYEFALPQASRFASGHLVVEHGLQNSALLTFLTRPYRFQDLELSQLRTLVGASYNSLVDWHITIDSDSVTYLHNRIDPPNFYTQRKAWGRGSTDNLSTAKFQEISAKHPVPNVPALDAALIRTISFWKRALAMESPTASVEQISALFNGVILARALEDHSRNIGNGKAYTLRSLSYATDRVDLVNVLGSVLASYSLEIPATLWDVKNVEIFRTLEPATTRELIEDFYRNRFHSYFDYDFSVMSKHALSRVYEQYVSLLRVPEVEQTSLFGVLPAQQTEKSYGNVYTPEFIARFFSKYVRREMPLPRFQRMRVGDPACGSGIFLRTMIETKSESLFQERTTQNVEDAFTSTLGIDIDENACAATRLSLSLLSLVLIDRFPKNLDIRRGDTLQPGTLKDDVNDRLDVVVANPPFVNIEHLSDVRKRLVWDALGGQTKGKTDLYLAILKLSIRQLSEGGFGCFVLPKNFFISDNAAPLREYLLSRANLRCVVDLSAVKVFEDVGAYVILLIFQKAAVPNPEAPLLAATCSDLVGPALEDVLNERTVRNAAYQIYWTKQPHSTDSSWAFPLPERVAFEQRFERFPKLSEVAELRQGIITGSDDTFIVAPEQVPKSERSIYVPLLRDRDMAPFAVPKTVKNFLIYPFDEHGAVSEARMQLDYPITWAYLEGRKENLLKRKSITSGKGVWWRPLWPREKRKLLCPKIITPHLVITPRFSFDSKGEFAVSHSPYIALREPAHEEENLFMLAVLNSTTCFWLISQQAHSYSRGYSRLEMATLRNVRIPHLSVFQTPNFREIVALTRERLSASGSSALQIERQLDHLVADAYGLTLEERAFVGLIKK